MPMPSIGWSYPHQAAGNQDVPDASIRRMPFCAASEQHFQSGYRAVAEVGEGARGLIDGCSRGTLKFAN